MNIFRRTEKNNLSRVLSYINVVGVLLLGLFLLLLLPETAGSKETGGKEVVEQPPVARKDSEEVNRMESIVEELAEQGVIVEADPERGQLRFPGKILFDLNSARLSDEGKKYLEQKIPLYLGTLLQEPFRDEIAMIVIEGHTDRTGSYPYNMKLSQERANAVFQYIYSEQFPAFAGREQAKSYVVVRASSSSVPIYHEGEYDPHQSRRVEISLQLKKEAKE